MWEALDSWSFNNLGQWHYILGYIITTVAHNWPILLALALCLWFGYKAYRQPSREMVCWLLTAIALGLAYEYQKHVAGELHKAVDLLFGAEIAALNRPMHLLVGPAMTTILQVGFLALLVLSLRQSVQSRRFAANEVWAPLQPIEPPARDDTTPDSTSAPSAP